MKFQEVLKSNSKVLIADYLKSNADNLTVKQVKELEALISSLPEASSKRLFGESELNALLKAGVISQPSKPYTEDQEGDYTIRVTNKHVTKGRRQRVVIMGECTPPIPNRDATKENEGLTLNNLVILRELCEGTVLSFQIRNVTFPDGTERRFATDFEVVA